MSARMFAADASISASAVSVTVSALPGVMSADSGARGKYVNPSKFPLTNVLVVVPSVIRRLGAIAYLRTPYRLFCTSVATRQARLSMSSSLLTLATFTFTVTGAVSASMRRLSPLLNTSVPAGR